MVDTAGPTILGLPTCTDLNLITLNYSISTQLGKSQPLGLNPSPTGDLDARTNLLKQFGDCFQGEFHISLDPSVTPVIHPPQRVPEALREPLKKELILNYSIAKVEQPTDWLNRWFV